MTLGIAILAAGKGKRMQNPSIPKVLTPLKGKPLIGYVIETSLKLSPFAVYIIVGFKKELVVDFCQENYDHNVIHFVEQKEQLGTGHAVLQIEPYLDKSISDLLILSGDVPLISASTLNKFIGFHNENRNDLSLISTIVPDPSGYGRIIRNNNGKLVKIVEHKDLNNDGTKLNEINTGIYIVNTEYLFEGLKQIRNENAQQEYYLTDLVEVFLSEQLKVDALLIENYIEVLGVNTFDELKYLENVMDTGKEK